MSFWVRWLTTAALCFALTVYASSVRTPEHVAACVAAHAVAAVVIGPLNRVWTFRQIARFFLGYFRRPYFWEPQ